MNMKYMIVVIAIVFMAFVAIAVLPSTAYASAAGKRNTAIGLGAASIYELSKGHTGAGLLLGAGTVYAVHKYNQGDKSHHKAVYKISCKKVPVTRYTSAGTRYTAYKKVCKRYKV